MTECDPRHTRMREMLLLAGGRGASLAQLGSWLSQENYYAAKADITRWLEADEKAGLVASPDGGCVWAWTGPEPESGSWHENLSDEPR